jgi:flagellin
MAFSVNTNTSALAALQNLNATQSELSSVQQRINTGLRVSSAKDDSSAFVIAQNLRSDLSGMKSVTSSLNRAKSVLDVTLSGATQISDLMNQMQAKALEASDAGLDQKSRDALQLDFKALQNQISTVVKSSDFNGTNLLDGTPATPGSLSALQSIKGTSTLVVANLKIQGTATAPGMMIQTVPTAAAGNAATTYDLLGSQATPGTGLGGANAVGATAPKNASISNEIDAKDVMASLELAKATMATNLNTLGSAARQVDSQLSFTAKLGDALTSGIGTLVDADLAKESANLQALQLKQQLGVQALSIANQSPQSISSLFR